MAKAQSLTRYLEEMAMSNQVIFYTQIGSILAFISTLFVLYRLLVHQKDATIQLLTEKNRWLQDQVNALKETRPDVLLDNLEKRLNLTSEELIRLNEDKETNIVRIGVKEKEIADLLLQIEDLKSRIDECPHCGAELTVLGGDDEEVKVYACGHSTGYTEYPCPYDPNFPMLDDYELRTKYLSDRKVWICFPEPKTEMAEKLKLDMMKGRTEQESIEGVRRAYAFHARNVPKKEKASSQ